MCEPTHITGRRLPISSPSFQTLSRTPEALDLAQGVLCSSRLTLSMSQELDAQTNLQGSGRTLRNQRKRFSRHYEQVKIRFSILVRDVVAGEACTRTCWELQSLIPNRGPNVYLRKLRS